ncbi:MAG: antitermination protein NusB [Desulfovibrionaceae bacterium]|nr:antitermination protein NusB [Desulfovibrionaceae bacterium]
MPSDARSACIDILARVYAGCPVQEALDYPLDLHAKDQALLHELTLGVLRTEIRLNTILERYLSASEKLPIAMWHILQIGLYSLLFLERIPDHAAVSSAVNATENRFGTKLARVTNAVLRAILRDRPMLLEPAWYVKKDEPLTVRTIHALARFYSLPTWLLRYWVDAYGIGAGLALARRSFERPQIGLLFAKGAALPVGSGVRRISPTGFVLTAEAFRRFSESNDIQKLHAEGTLSYLAGGTQAVLAKLGLTESDGPFWDMCAGFGGKSGYLANLGIPVALCTDTSWKRLSQLARDFARRKLPLPVRVLADAKKPPLTRFAGGILLDAPCSSLGVLARRPDVKLNRQKKRSLRLFPPQQKALLQSGLSLLEKNRRLAYITCTVNPQENGALIRETIAHSSFELEYEWQTPHTEYALEGMYGALIRRM